MQPVEHVALCFLSGKVADQRCFRRVCPKFFQRGLVVFHDSLLNYDEHERQDADNDERQRARCQKVIFPVEFLHERAASQNLAVRISSDSKFCFARSCQ